MTAVTNTSAQTAELADKISKLKPYETVTLNMTGRYISGNMIGDINALKEKNIVISLYGTQVNGKLDFTVSNVVKQQTNSLFSSDTATVSKDLADISTAVKSGVAKYVPIVVPDKVKLDSRISISSTESLTQIETTNIGFPDLLTPGGFGVVIVITKNSSPTRIHLSRANYLQQVCTPLTESTTNYSSTTFWLCNGVWIISLLLLLIICWLCGKKDTKVQV